MNPGYDLRPRVLTSKSLRTKAIKTKLNTNSFSSTENPVGLKKMNSQTKNSLTLSSASSKLEHLVFELNEAIGNKPKLYDIMTKYDIDWDAVEKEDQTIGERLLILTSGERLFFDVQTKKWAY
jgi:hypothetical protein